MFYLKSIIANIMSIETIRRQSIVWLIWQIAYTIIGFLSTIYFAHTVGASVLGAYFLFIAYLGIISLVTDSGFGGAAIKRISEGEDQDAYFSSFFVVRLIITTVIVIALFGIRDYFVDLNDEGLFFWLVLALIMSSFYNIVSSGVAGCGKMGISATGNFINNLSRVLIQVISVFLGFSIAGLAGGFVAGLFIAAIFELRFFDLKFVNFKLNHIKSLTTYSFWAFLTTSGYLVYSYADTVMIGYYMDNANVGVYRVVLQFTMLATLTTHATLQTLFPKVSRWSKTGDIKSIEYSLSHAITYSLILAVPVFTGGILLGDKLLYFFYGPEFENGYLVFLILLIVQIVNVFQFFFTNYLNALNHQIDSFKVTAVAASINIALNLLLIPIIGIIGAAIATLITMTINALLARRLLSKIIKVVLEYNSLQNIFKASAIMSILIGGYRIFVPIYNIWLTLLPVLFGGLVYGIIILKFDVEIRNEIKNILLRMNLL